MTDITDERLPESFEHQVRDCLTHLYDFAALQVDPIAEILAPDLRGKERVQTVRRILVEAIENLNLDDADEQPKHGRAYNVLSMRFIQEQSTQEIMIELALSERQYYREQRSAIQALSRMLWDRIASNGPPRPAETLISVQTEVERINSQLDYISLDAEELFAGVIAAVKSLADEHHITLEFQASDDLPIVRTNRLLLRQSLIRVVLQLLKQTTSNGTLRLGQRSVSQRPEIVLELHAQVVDPESLRAILEQHDTLIQLLRTLQADLTYSQAAEQFELVVHLPSLNQHSVLVIDDNPDFIDLVRRYLKNLPYDIVTPNRLDESIQAASEAMPIVILLDVMLPETDGWELLQALKNYPATQQIPLYVCSVLEIPELALALGANGFLKKPPDQDVLVSLLSKFSV